MRIASEKQIKIKFSKAFWVANSVELLERAAYYGVFIVITLYLSRILGFSDIEAGIISGVFSGGLYFLPTFSGAYADKIGFKKSLLLAFTLLTIGYLGLALLPGILEAKGLAEYGKEVIYKGIRTSSEKYYIIPVMLVIMVG
ncbi:MAG: MFS transporter, partial [Bacteroidales bacterium]|nr:MFS transporter [Bacteroidales bacterium]